jgi:hypothetical protein
MDNTRPICSDRRMARHLATASFGLLVILAIGAAVFRVATTPDRIKERRETARQVCLASGGQWVPMERDHACLRPGDPAPLMGKPPA